MPGCHEDTIYYLDFGYAIFLDFYNKTLEDVLYRDLVELALVRKVLKYIVVGLILFHTEIIFHSDIKTWSILQCGSSWKLTEFQSLQKIGDAACNAEKYNWGYYPSKVAVTLLNSEQTHTFSGLATYNIWYLGCIICHLIFGYPIWNVYIQQINGPLSVLYTIDSISLQCL